jgi:hypothetical protein
MAAGTATAGPAAGTARSDLCKQVMACARATGCAVEGDDTPCYCGTANDSACQSGGANGPCKSIIEAASESTDPSDVAARFGNADPNDPAPYAIGFATFLVGCDFASCNDPCTMGDPPSAGGGATGSGGIAASGSGGAGSATASGGIVGSGGTVATGGAVGSGGVTGTGGTTTPPPPCADLNGNGVPDCNETAVTNSTFTSNVSFWNLEVGMAASWLAGPAADAAGSPASGGIAVANPVVADLDGQTIGGVRQCLAPTGSVYSAWGQVYVPANQSAGSAGIVLVFYPTTDCSGPPSDQALSGFVTAPGAWTTLQASSGVPSGTMSVAVRLAIQKPFRSPSFQAYFDNILVKPQ